MLGAGERRLLLRASITGKEGLFCYLEQDKGSGVLLLLGGAKERGGTQGGESWGRRHVVERRHHRRWGRCSAAARWGRSKEQSSRVAAVAW